jgi:hypothetical protein
VTRRLARSPPRFLRRPRTASRPVFTLVEIHRVSGLWNEVVPRPASRPGVLLVERLVLERGEQLSRLLEHELVAGLLIADPIRSAALVFRGFFWGKGVVVV